MSPREQQACRELAVRLLREYRLSVSERADETERLTTTIMQAAAAELENLEHRKGTELL